jgi:hypothetical protein
MEGLCEDNGMTSSVTASLSKLLQVELTNDNYGLQDSGLQLCLYGLNCFETVDKICNGRAKILYTKSCGNVIYKLPPL